MTHFHLFKRDDRQPGSPPVAPEAPRDKAPAAVPEPEDQGVLTAGPVSGTDAEPEPEPDDHATSWAALNRQTTTRAKLSDGFRGIKHAVRGDSSFFAHGYRGLLIAISAAILGISPAGWCFLIVSAALVLIAEMAHCAVNALAFALGEPDEPGVRVAREIAAAGVLVASITSAAITITVLVTKLDHLLDW